MARKPSRITQAKITKNDKPFSVKALTFKQGKHTLYCFTMKASRLWSFASISRREEDKDVGYQRALSSSRTAAVSQFIVDGNLIPLSVLLSLSKGVKFDENSGVLKIPAGSNVAWVVDGQHRLAGAHLALQKGKDIEFAVVGYIGENEEFDIAQFVTINREAKNVPTSLVYDLLKKLPGRKRPSDIAVERATELANELKRDELSPFYNRIVVMTSPRDGQLSLTNFVRKVTPLVNSERGLLNVYTFEEQKRILSNFYDALRRVYPSHWSKSTNIFFKTLGFGAMFNVFDIVFKETLQRNESSFSVESITNILQKVAHFDFSQWNSYGSGSKAEIEAGNDFRVDLVRHLADAKDGKRIKL